MPAPKVPLYKLEDYKNRNKVTYEWRTHMTPVFLKYVQQLRDRGELHYGKKSSLVHLTELTLMFGLSGTLENFEVGLYLYKYEGELNKDNLPCGKGIATDKDGDTYSCDSWIDGKRWGIVTCKT